QRFPTFRKREVIDVAPAGSPRAGGDAAAGPSCQAAEHLGRWSQGGRQLIVGISCSPTPHAPALAEVPPRQLLPGHVGENESPPGVEQEKRLGAALEKGWPAETFSCH